MAVIFNSSMVEIVILWGIHIIGLLMMNYSLNINDLYLGWVKHEKSIN